MCLVYAYNLRVVRFGASGERKKVTKRSLCSDFGPPDAMWGWRGEWDMGLLHLWELQDCSLYTNELVYSPPSAPHASPWPGLVGGTSASMTLVAGPPVPTSEVAFRALRALLEASVGTAAHRGDTERATAARTA